MAAGNRRTVAVGFLVLLLGGTGALAAEVEEVAVSRDGERYRVDMSVALAVPAAAAYAAMTDFPDLPRINPNVVLVDTHGEDLLHTIVEMCLGPFCRRLEQWQRVMREPPGMLRMTVLPERSDLRYGDARWTFEDLGDGASRLGFAAELEPDFWVPPLIGPWMIRKKLREQAVITARGLERAAREREDEAHEH